MQVGLNLRSNFGSLYTCLVTSGAPFAGCDLNCALPFFADTRRLSPRRGEGTVETEAGLLMTFPVWMVRVTVCPG